MHDNTAHPRLKDCVNRCCRGSWRVVVAKKKTERSEERYNERSLARHSRNLNALSKLAVEPL